MFYIIIIILILLFIPIPLKLNVEYEKNLYCIKFYNLTLLSNDNNTFKKVNMNQNLSSKNNNKKKKNSKDKKKKISFKKLLNNLSKNYYKPTVKLISKLEYSLNDAAYTAIFYGILNNLNPVIYHLLSIIFKVKEYKVDILPKFNDKILLNTKISCILTINIAKSIYMLFLIKKSFITLKEVSQ